MYLGAQMSVAGGVHRAIERGQSIECTAIQLFTKSNNRWMSKDLTEKEIEQFQNTWSKSPVKKIVAHTGYLINLAGEAENWHKSMDSMEDELVRAHQLGISWLVLHPGSHLGKGEEYGLKRIAESLNTITGKHPENPVKILLETTAGQGTNLGYTFEQLAQILQMVKEPERYGICFDTCHTFCAGYELRTEKGYHETFEQFDAVLGLKILMAFHLNDSKTGLGTRRDRHEHIGKGELGLEPFRFLLNDPRFKEIPMVLETPKDEETLAEDIENLHVLHSLIQ